MTEVTADTNVSAQSAPIAPVTPAAQPAVQEETLPQSEVNKLIGRYKNEAYEKGKRDALQSLQTQQPQNVQPAYQQPQMVGGMQQQTPDAIDKMIDDKVNAKLATHQQNLAMQQHEGAVRNFAMQFEQKIVQGQQKYGAEYDQVLRDINLPELAKTNPAFVTMVGSADNAADILKDLHDRPQQLSTILNLAANPATQGFAQAQLNQLSQSIKQNDQATKQQNAPEPLGQIKPSPTGADNGTMSMRDLKKVDWLRG